MLIGHASSLMAVCRIAAALAALAARYSSCHMN
jgi:hypothetical protein